MGKINAAIPEEVKSKKEECSIYLYGSSCGARAATACDVRLQDITAVELDTKLNLLKVTVSSLSYFFCCTLTDVIRIDLPAQFQEWKTTLNHFHRFSQRSFLDRFCVLAQLTSVARI